MPNLTINKNAIILDGIECQESWQHKSELNSFVESLGATLVEFEYGADLLQAMIRVDNEHCMLTVNYITGDLWIELAKHHEKTFFAVYDQLEVHATKM